MKMEIWKEIKDYPNYMVSVNKLQHMVLSGNIQKRQDKQNWKRIKKKKRQHPLKKTAIKQIYNM